jgi:hypothetical protein
VPSVLVCGRLPVGARSRLLHALELTGVSGIIR